MQPDGRGTLGVALVGEALDEQEAEQGKPFVGPAGNILNNALARAGIDRGMLLILNAIWCRPPDNKLLGRPYYQPAAQHCNHAHMAPALLAAKPKVIVALGDISFFQLTQQGEILDARGYPVWSDRYNCWILPTVHPSYIQRGNFNYEAILIHDLQRATEIALQGYAPKWGTYLLDPTPSEALQWARLALASEYPLSADIETPHKGKKEDEASLADESYSILRISFSSKPYEGMSIPWRPEYMAAIRLLLESSKDKVWWYAAYDVPRIEFNGVKIGGVSHDGMVAWHVLNTDLPKDLGTVATFLTPDQPRWKNLSESRPAFYNAVDSDVALRCTLRAFDELKKAGLWRVYERHVVRIDQITARMSRAGMPLDRARQLEAAKKVAIERAGLDRQLEEVVPFELKPKFVYKKAPRSKEGLVRVGDEILPVCAKCGMERPPKSHFAKPTLKHPERTCGGASTKEENVGKWARMEELKVSWKLTLAYQEFKKHPKVYHGKGEDRKPTTNENAIRQLLLKFEDDPYYPLVLKISKMRTLAGRYIGKPHTFEDGHEGVLGGLLVGPDGRVHTVFSHNPSTLRQASENPNMQNIPRTADEWASLVKGMFVAGKGKTFIARDYSGIESVLVGYFAGSRGYTRISLIDVHSFVAAWALYELEGKIPYADVPQLSWSNDDLRLALAQVKKKWKVERQGIKHMGHASNYGAKAKKTQEVLFDELGVMVPLKEIKRFKDFYAELFPEIPRWHTELAKQVNGSHAEKDLFGLSTGAGYVRNPYGYLHRFYEVIRWEKIYGKWEWKFGETANELFAFPAQSTAAGIIKEAAIRFDDSHPELAPGLRLFVHDEILGEWHKDQQEEVLWKLKVAMEAPNPELPLDPEWNMGEFLVIPTEGKVGAVWSEMVEVKD